MLVDGYAAHCASSPQARKGKAGILSKGLKLGDDLNAVNDLLLGQFGIGR